MIITIKGDLFDATQDIIAHGCNCSGGFGSGVAGTMAKKHNLAQQKYWNKFQIEGWRLGDVQFVESKGKIIANCGTQKKYLPRGIRHVDYDAVRTVMEKLYKYCKENNKSIAIPKIGSGLAGGDWKIIKNIINDVFVDLDIYVYYL